MIAVHEVGHTYADDRPALRDLSFTIGRGEKVVLLGANGSGKTTLLRILDGLLFPHRGAYRYDGTPINGKTLGRGVFRKRFRREVVLLFQNPETMLFHPTVRDEIAFGPRQFGFDDPEGTAERWAASLGIGHLAGRSPFDLSDGEKKKVCLAAILAIGPELLLLDEPAANLDPRSTGWLIDFLGELHITIVTATHNPSLGAEFGERTLVLSEDHRLVYDGPVDRLARDRRKLLEANLVHLHRHRHENLEHTHYHTHEWE